MADVQLSTHVWLSGGGASGYGTVPTPTAEQIANAQAAIDSFTTDVDSFLVEDVWLYIVPQSFFDTDHNWTSSGTQAWGYTPTKGKAFISSGLSLRNQKYTIGHEIFHTVDSSKGVMNSAKRATIAALMTNPTVNTGVAGYWGNGSSPIRPSEVFADTAPAAYMGLFSLSYYTRKIPSGSYAAYRSALGGASLPASTTLAAAAAAAATNIKVTSVAGLSAGDWVVLNGIESHEIATVGTAGSGGTGLTLSQALQAGFASGVSVKETTPLNDVLNGAIDVIVNLNTVNGTTRSHSIPGLVGTGNWQMRFFDGQVWGPYSDPTPYSVGAVLGRPANLVPAGTSANPAIISTLEPVFGASLVSTDPSDYISRYYLQVMEVTGTGFIQKTLFNTQPVEGILLKRIEVPYTGNAPAPGGGPLEWNKRYRWITELYNKDGDYTLRSDWQEFIPVPDVGPLITPSDPTVKLGSTQPTFTLAHRLGQNITQARLVLRSLDNVILYDSGVTSFASAANKAMTVPAGYLAPGQDFLVSGQVKGISDPTITVESNATRMHVNATPGTPFPVGVAAPAAQVIRRADGVYVVTTDTPTLTFPFRDVDIDLGFADSPTRREIEVRTTANAEVGASPFVITTGITNSWVVAAGLLAAETNRKARARYDDDSGLRSGWSDDIFLRRSSAPTFTTVTPPDPTDPTPTWAWVLAGSGGKVQGGYWLRIRSGGSIIRDTGLRLGTASSTTLATGDIPNGTAVDWELYGYDTDLAGAPGTDPASAGLYALATGSYVASYAAPTTVTGLVVTPSPELDAFIVTWDASLDPNIDSYRVYTRQLNGQFRLVAEVTDPTAVVLAAPHNVETTVRVTQWNGAQESAPAEATAILGGAAESIDFIDGYQLVRPERIIDLPSAEHGTGDTKADKEQFGPPNRPEKVILNWGATGYEGSIRITTRDRELLLTLRDWKDQGLISILKTWYGEVRYIELLDTPDTDMQAGMATQELRYVEVLPRAL